MVPAAVSSDNIPAPIGCQSVCEMPQVAEQQGKYLAKCLNDEARGHDGPQKPFVYHHLGSMASLGAHACLLMFVLGLTACHTRLQPHALTDFVAGGRSAIIELGEPTSRHFDFKGFTSWLAWRSAYLTRLGARLKPP